MKKQLSQEDINKYIWWQDEKFRGIIILFIAQLIFIFSFIKIEFITTIDGYTFKMLFGYLSPIVYFFISMQAFKKIFDNNKILKYFKLKTKSFIIMICLVSFILVSFGFYLIPNKISYVSIGKKPWHAMEVWFKLFTNEGKANAWFPEYVNGGLVGALMFSFISSVATPITSLVISCTSILLLFSLVTTNSFFKLYVNGYKIIFKKEKEGFEKTSTIQNNDTLFKETNDKENKVAYSNNLAIRQKVKTDEVSKMTKLSDKPKDLLNNDNIKIKKEVVSEKNDKKENILPFDDPFNI